MQRKFPMDTQNELPIQYIHHETWDYAPLFSNDINGKPKDIKGIQILFQDYFLSKYKESLLLLNMTLDYNNLAILDIS